MLSSACLVSYCLDSGLESVRAIGKKREELLDRPEYLMEFILLVKTIEKSRLAKRRIRNTRAKAKLGLQTIKELLERELKTQIHSGLLIAALKHLGFEIKKTDDDSNPLIGFDPNIQDMAQSTKR